MSGAEGDLQLEVVGGNASGTTIEVGERLVFGRQSEGQGKLANDPELSRHHAELSRTAGGEYQLEDLSSTNGTFVNGGRIEEPVVLSVGDTIELGTTKIIVRALPAVASVVEEVDVRAATVTVGVPPAMQAPPAPQPPTEPLAPPSPAPSPPLELRLRVDLEAGEAEIALDEGASVRFSLQGGRWSLAPGDGQ